MYMALERHRLYRIAEAVVEYRGREFPEDHPPIFHFIDVASGEEVSFSLDQLTHFESEANIEYLGVAL